MNKNQENYSSASYEVNPVILFLIGLTAGIISISFPRLMTFLSIGETNVKMTLFPSGFIFAVIIFSVIVGVSMIWFYLGTKENTKNLFLAALSLPAILSGGINMSNTTSMGQIEIEKISLVNNQLIQKLEDSLSITTIPEIAFEDDGEIIKPVGSISLILGVSPAYAAGADESSNINLSPSVAFNSKSQTKNYIILLEKSPQKSQIINKMNTYTVNGTLGLKMKKSQNFYYLIKDKKMTQSDAMLEAIKLKDKYTISPQLMKTK